MKICVLINAHAGPASSNEPLAELLRHEPNCVVRELKSEENWDPIFAEVLSGDYERIVAAGGDGTVHAVINALLNAGSRTTLGIVPLGTGNDLCRSLAIPFDPVEAFRLLQSRDGRLIDAIRVEGDRTGYFANAATGGFSGQVAAEVTSETKSTWGPLAYLRGAVAPLADPPRFRLQIRFDGGPAESIEALNIVIANGRTAAGGIKVAPTASPEDGLLDVVVVRFSDTLDLSLLASRLMHGNYVDDENVVHRLAKRVKIESDVAMPFSIDGERCEGRRFTFEIVPQALRVVVGPDYTAEFTPAAPIEVEGESEATSSDTQPSRERLFGLLTGLLLVVKRIRSGPAVWIMGITAIVLLSAWLAQGVVAGEWNAWNERALDASRSHASESLTRVAMMVTWFGGVWGTILVSALLLVQFVRTRHYLTAGTFVAVLIGVLLMEAVLKPLFALARPDPSDSFPAVAGYAFPSGHALRGAGIYGLLAALAAIRARGQFWWCLVAVLFAAVATAICWSRVYLGAHWLSDVVMGAVLAIAWVATCLIARAHVQSGARRTDVAR